MRKTKEAFNWIIDTLETHKVPYRISGGFAARLYGSKRKLADIDVEILDSGFKKILVDIKNYIKIGPKKFEDKNMKTYGVVMNYKGQILELSGTKTEYLFDINKKKWIKSRIDLSKITRKNVYGRSVKVIRRKDLIEYKRKLQREVDVRDLKFLTK